MNRRVSFSCESDAGFGVGVGGEEKRAILKIWIFKIKRSTRFSPASFFRQIGAKVVGALPSFLSSSSANSQRRCSRKVSSSAGLVRTRSYAETLDSQQRAEAIEDCIEFLNSSSSSSSLRRSNLVSSSC